MTENRQKFRATESCFARFAGEEADAEIDAAIGHFRSRGVPFLQSNWHTSSNSRRGWRGKSPAWSP